MLNSSFWEAFEKEASRKNSVLLERIRKGLPVKVKGQSIQSLGRTRLGKILRGLK